MARGRKAKPTAFKVLADARADRLNPDEPKPAAGRPVPPARFRPEVVAEWDRLCDELEALGVLNQSHGFALSVYCSAYARLLIAEEALNEHGALLVSTRGGTKEGDETEVVIKSNPAAAVAAACESTMLRVLTEFGLTAASVHKVKARKKEVDALSAFIARRNA